MEADRPEETSPPLQATWPRVPDGFELSLAQRFDQERFTRAIQEEKDLGRLKELAIILCGAYFTQKSANDWLIKQAVGAPPLS
jgi:hypothetical protein